ncbi:class I SAM-dependent methyltransferase [Streptomyces sp. NBC_01304]|uniref:class I SAM-dependent methyltransferase n=1 Tax=Streptomyces sp. NBC_01304 TaxID=2903818 RepID=UPI002E104566|nr:class I SAM-dependent methyltransferase [Streptomyces sp. NBC_01304]
MPVSGRDLYDDPRFFEGYHRLRQTGTGINDAIEIPALARLLPPVEGASVIDLGCGAGALARRLAAAGAEDVVAVDASERMLEAAAPHPKVRYVRADLETLTLPSSCADLAVSSMALHYVADYPGLVRRIADWLRPGGRLVFSHEHPVCTAHRLMPGWIPTGDGTIWPLDDYAAEGPRTQNWIIEGVVKYHRHTATLINALLDAGLELTGISEPAPDAAALAARPALAEHLRRPPILVLAAQRAAP